VSGRHREKLELLEAIGIGTVAPDHVEARSFDVAVECSGNPSGFTLARRALRARGTLVMKSTYAGELTVNASSLVVDELTLVGSRCGPFAPALQLLSEGRIDPRPLIHARYSLLDAVAAFEHAQKPGVLKVIVRCSEEPG
jgi:threonine dehydrogenase-like Zn-dependent dehydrogenase